MTKQKSGFRELVHSPADLGTEGIEWAEKLQGVPGVPFGVLSVDREMIPMHPGDMIVFCGRPGHGKTSILCYLARAEAKRIQERETQNEECVIYVTFEQVTEEINAVLEARADFSPGDIIRGQVDMDLVRRAAIERVDLPIWIVGDSLKRTTVHSPRMYPETVFRAIEAIISEYGRKPTLVCVDYIQLIPIPKMSDRQKQVIEAAHGMKELAKRVGAPLAVAVQAGRQVDQRDMKIPGLDDGQWSSSIEQASDKYFGLWRPWLTEPHRTASGNVNTVSIDHREYPVTELLFIMSMMKQRFARGRHTWALHFHPQYLQLCELEMDVESYVD